MLNEIIILNKTTNRIKRRDKPESAHIQSISYRKNYLKYKIFIFLQVLDHFILLLFASRELLFSELGFLKIRLD